MKNTEKIYTNKLLIFIILTNIISSLTLAQNLNVPLNHESSVNLYRNLTKNNSDIHTGFKPLTINNTSQTEAYDSLIYKTPALFFKQKPNNVILRKLFFEDLISVKANNFNLQANPLFYIQLKNNREQAKSYTVNTRGVEIKGSLGKKINYYTSFFENQAFFDNPLDSFVRKRLIVPGMGAHKTFRDSGYDYSSATAYLSYSPCKILNLRLGHDKHFIGYGYRSLLLSDNAFNYPFLEFSLSIKNFRYHSLIAQYEDFRTVYYYYHRKKHIAINYLSFHKKGLPEIGLFEGVLYQSLDTATNNYKLPWDFYIPIPAVRGIANTNTEKHYLLTGIQIKQDLLKNISLYSQFAFSPTKKGKGFQAGIKIHDLFFNAFLRHKFFINTEYNKVSNNLYIHPDNEFQSWSHYNQELAHPLGSNFEEWIVRGQYDFSRLSVYCKFINRTYSNTTSNIFTTPPYQNPNDAKQTSSLASINLAYTINPAYP